MAPAHFTKTVLIIYEMTCFLRAQISLSYLTAIVAFESHLCMTYRNTTLNEIQLYNVFCISCRQLIITSTMIVTDKKFYIGAENWRNMKLWIFLLDLTNCKTFGNQWENGMNSFLISKGLLI